MSYYLTAGPLAPPGKVRQTTLDAQINPSRFSIAIMGRRFFALVVCPAISVKSWLFSGGP
jgi:hypothetical protein